ncbi:MAG: hypothetical protein IPL72_08820 [Sulfuritalea sp.]|nr:hypothetical protein [Sulfuritalea sp.]
MRYIPLGFSLLFAVLSAPTLAADAEAGLLAVKSLGGVNGQALACAETKVAARARELMLAHAPKTQRFGAAYEEATQEAYTAQTRSGQACASATELTARLNALALRLSDALPVAAK